MIEIDKYNDNEDREQVIALWGSVFDYRDTRNDPGLCIDNKLSVKDNLFFVAKEAHNVVGTIMAGYDGHRGWIYSLAVIPEKRKQKIGTRLLKHAEKRLMTCGCVKINVQIISTNQSVVDFYQKNGYKIEERISMGKEIVENIPQLIVKDI
jgi:ribosomal protein S18 acetylase RimI-like enzyme